MAKKEQIEDKIYGKAEINALIKENTWLKKENKYLKKLTNSKRFKFAEKVATGYNGIFPINTKRRDFLQSIGKVLYEVRNKQVKRKIAKKSQEIVNMASSYKQIIVLNSIPWDTKLRQRPHHLADEFKKLDYFVIYLEDNPLCQFRLIEDGLITINSYELLEKFQLENKFKYFLTPNNMPTEYNILQSVKGYGFGIIYDYLDEFHEDISGDLSIQLKVWDNLKKLNPILCIATAKRLYKQLETHLKNKKHLVMASNAVNVDHFNYQKNKEKSTPYSLKKVLSCNHPIIGFYGALAPWIDFDLINSIAKKHQDWEFVFLGIDYNGAAIDLANYKNIHNLGAKDYQDLPSYAKYFDCAIIPFRQGEIAKATSPVKLFEYMAAGLPTVCTRDLDECRGYNYVYMAKNDAEFEEYLKIAIKDKQNPEVRKKLLEQAEKNTWEQRAITIDNALKKEAKEHI